MIYKFKEERLTHLLHIFSSVAIGIFLYHYIFISFLKNMNVTLKMYISSLILLLFSSVQSSRSVVSDSLQPPGPQHARPPCLSPTPGVYPNSCPLSRWCHLTISSRVLPFSCPHLSQHQGLFKWVNSSQQVAKLLEFQLQHPSYQWTSRTDLL